jgi:uncharacterized protein YaiL (DUF2058 family)
MSEQAAVILLWAQARSKREEAERSRELIRRANTDAEADELHRRIEQLIKAAELIEEEAAALAVKTIKDERDEEADPQ